MLRAGQLVMMLLFDVYCVCVQVNAVAYLAGRVRPPVPGTAPPVPLTSGMAAAADIIGGVIIEAVTVLIFCIATALALTRIRDRRNAVSRP